MRSFKLGSVLVLALGVLAFSGGAEDALAKGRRNRGNRGNRDTARMLRPAHGNDSDAAGSVEITKNRRGADGTVKLRNLLPRTNYEVFESATGLFLGETRTNRKGRANFDLNAKPSKSRRAGTADSNGAEGDPAAPIDVEDMEGIEVYCETDGECVLECDFETSFNDFFADFRIVGGDLYEGSPETGTVMASLWGMSDPEFAQETFSFTFCPSYDPEDGGYDMPHSAWFDSTADGLPLGADSVEELSGVAFQVKSLDGTVVYEGNLPEVTDLTDQFMWVEDEWDGEDEWGGEFEWEFDGDDDWNSEWDEDWDGTWDDMTMPPVATGRMNTRGKRASEEQPEPISTYTLCLLDPETEAFVKVADLDYYDPFAWDDDWNWEDSDEWEWDGEDEWNWDGEEPWFDGGPAADGNPAGDNTQNRRGTTRKPRRPRGRR